MTTLYIVLPCYKEEEALPLSAPKLKEKLLSLIDKNKISDDSRILFVNDGSKDGTWRIINELHEQDRHFTGISLSRNRGHQNALLAGLETAAKYADAIISMDVDLQDDIGAVDEMLEKFEAGCDVVYGVRKARKKDSFFKRFTAEGFYKIINKMGGDIVFNQADYHLMSKRAVNALGEYKECNLFLRGLVPMIGFKSDIVLYERDKRVAGESKYPLKKMLAFAYDGVTSLTLTPLKFIRRAGIFFTLTGILGLAATITLFCLSIASSVWIVISSLVTMGGILEFSLGIVGDYVGKTYFEVKHRPRYFIAENLLED